MLTLSDRLHCSREQRQAGQTGAPSLGEDYDLCPAGDRGIAPDILLYLFSPLYLYFTGCVHAPSPRPPNSTRTNQRHREQVQNQRHQHQVPLPQEQGRHCGQGGR